jgi:hypothetical protein
VLGEQLLGQPGDRVAYLCQFPRHSSLGLAQAPKLVQAPAAKPSARTPAVSTGTLARNLQTGGH